MFVNCKTIIPFVQLQIYVEMKKKFTFKLTAVLFTLIILFSGCASSTLIQSHPTGAKVYINGEPVGNTPYLYSDTKILGSVTNVDLIKEGYEPLYTSIERNEQVDVGAIVGGFFFGFPFLWTLQYNPTHNYELIPLEQSQDNYSDVLSPEDNATTPTSIPQAVSPKVQRLRELKQLLDEDVITTEDYEKQKQKILDEL